MLGRDQEPQRRMVDIDLLPQIYVPRGRFTYRGQALDREKLAWGLAAVGALLLGFWFMEWNAIAAQLVEVEKSITIADARRREVRIDPAVVALQDKLQVAKRRLEGVEKDSGDILDRQWPWGRILQRLVDLKPEPVRLSSLAQMEQGTLTLEGTAESQAVVVAYAGRLRQSGLFTEVAIPSLATKLVPVDAVAPGGAFGSGPPGIPSFIPPSRSPAGALMATPTPALDYLVASTTRISRPGSGRDHEITGQALDRFGRPVAGVSFRVSSCCPVWSADFPPRFDPAAPGTFQFFVGPGTFTVQVLNVAPGRSQEAIQLHTADAGPAESFEWHIIFQKITDAPVVPAPPALALTPTPTFVPTPSGTPVLGPPAAAASRPGVPATPAPPGLPSATPTPNTELVATPGTTLAVAPTAAASPSPTAVPMREVMGFSLRLTLRPVEQRRP